jgi:hypothetical protein
MLYTGASATLTAMSRGSGRHSWAPTFAGAAGSYLTLRPNLSTTPRAPDCVPSNESNYRNGIAGPRFWDGGKELDLEYLMNAAVHAVTRPLGGI